MGSTRPDAGGTTGSEERTASAGDLPSAIYAELRVLAHDYLSRQRPDHTLPPTALVHEAYLRLAKQSRFQVSDQVHFFCLAARAMRSILIDHARRRNSMKRGGNATRVPLDDTVAFYNARAMDLLALDEALERLGALQPRLARMIELRFFGGLSLEEAAATLGVSDRTVRRDWLTAKAWLHHELSEGEQHGP
jgi:RNA polymerase sigma factor (TIGR02999 family)